MLVLLVSWFYLFFGWMDGWVIKLIEPIELMKLILYIAPLGGEQDKNLDNHMYILNFRLTMENFVF